MLANRKRDFTEQTLQDIHATLYGDASDYREMHNFWNTYGADFDSDLSVECAAIDDEMTKLRVFTSEVLPTTLNEITNSVVAAEEMYAQKTSATVAEIQNLTKAANKLAEAIAKPGFETTFNSVNFIETLGFESKIPLKKRMTRTQFIETIMAKMDIDRNAALALWNSVLPFVSNKNQFLSNFTTLYDASVAMDPGTGVALSELAAWIAALITADGPLPIGDIIAIIGIVAFALLLLFNVIEIADGYVMAVETTAEAEMEAEASAKEEQEGTKPKSPKILNGNQADDIAKKLGYKDAHDFKAAQVGSETAGTRFDMYRDTATGEIWLRHKSTNTWAPTYLFYWPDEEEEKPHDE